MLNKKVIVVNMSGGFANQLYEYSFAYTLALKFNREIIQIVRNEECSIDPYALDIFKLPFQKKIIINSEPAVRNIFSDYAHDKKCYVVDDSNCVEVAKMTIYEIDEYDTLFLSGNFQNFACFKVYTKEIQKIFTYDSTYIEEFRKKIKQQISVGIHIRRRDFKWYPTHYVPESFYKAAVIFFENKFSNEDVHFYVFSDDIEEAKRILGIRKNISYIKVLGGRDIQFEDFFAL